jgi:hypothetical protein
MNKYVIGLAFLAAVLSGVATADDAGTAVMTNEELDKVTAGENPHTRPAGLGLGTAIDSGAAPQASDQGVEHGVGRNNNHGPCPRPTCP